MQTSKSEFFGQFMRKLNDRCVEPRPAGMGTVQVECLNYDRQIAAQSGQSRE